MIDVIGERLNINKETLPVSILSFDHPLSSYELASLIALLTESDNISQVYFKDDIDFESMEKVKYILEAMPTIEDSLIDKYIIKELSTDEKEQLRNMSFINIDTWNIAYSKEDNCNVITSLAKYRRMEEWFNGVLADIKDVKLSLMEKICYIYDRVKMFDYNDSDNYQRLPDIILSGKANSYGYNLVFKELLSTIGVPAIIGKIRINDEDSYITLALVTDVKYDIDGIYAFDSSSDTISKDQYRNNWARRMNYSFFALTLDKLSDVENNVQKYGIIKVLSSVSIDEFNQQLKLYERKHKKDDIKRIEDAFNMSIDEIYAKSKNTLPLSLEAISQIVSNRLDINPVKVIEKNAFMEMIHDNYQARNEELFSNKTKKYFVN